MMEIALSAVTAIAASLVAYHGLPPLGGPAFKLEFGAVDRPAGRDGA
jgi:hypothetical protein